MREPRRFRDGLYRWTPDDGKTPPETVAVWGQSSGLTDATGRFAWDASRALFVRQVDGGEETWGHPGGRRVRRMVRTAGGTSRAGTFKPTR